MKPLTEKAKMIIQFAEKLLSDEMEEPVKMQVIYKNSKFDNSPDNIRHIIGTFAEQWGLTYEDMIAKNGMKTVPLPLIRHMCYEFLCPNYLTYKAAVHWFGRVNHTTALHGKQAHSALYQFTPEYRMKFDAAINILSKV